MSDKEIDRYGMDEFLGDDWVQAMKPPEEQPPFDAERMKRSCGSPYGAGALPPGVLRVALGLETKEP